MAGRGLGIWICVIGVLFMETAARAGGFSLIDIGGRKSGMQTAVAKPDDLSAAYHNPAGLATLRGTRVHLSSGFSFIDLSLRLRAWPSTPGGVPGDGAYGSEDYIDTPVDRQGYFEGDIHPTYNFGAMPMLVASSDFGWDEGPVWAVGAYAPEVVAGYFPEDAPSRYLLTDGTYVMAVGALSVAQQVTDWLDLGASLGLLYVRFDGRRWMNRALPGLGDRNADVIARMVGEDWRLYANAGVCLRPIPGLTLGLSVVSGANVDLQGKLEVSLPEGWEEDPVIKLMVDQEILKPGRYEMHTEMTLPWGVGAGVNWEVMPELEVSFDFNYWFYQTYERMDIHHDFEILVETEEPMVVTPITYEKQYHGSWSVALGVLGRPFEFPLELMGGWTYKQSPSPSRAKSLDSPEITTSGGSVGLRYSLWENFRVSATYFRYWFLNYDVSDSILDPPQNLKLTGGLNTFSLVLELML